MSTSGHHTSHQQGRHSSASSSIGGGSSYGRKSGSAVLYGVVRRSTRLAITHTKSTAGTGVSNRSPRDTPKNRIPKNPTASGPELSIFLRSIEKDNGPSVYHKVISFKDGRDRQSWIQSMPDAEDRATVDEFFRHLLRGKRVRLGMISCTTENWVRKVAKPEGGQGTWDDMWHISAVAVLPGISCKQLLVWDCDPHNPEPKTDSDGMQRPRGLAECRAKEVLRGVQWHIWSKLLNQSKNAKLWYNTDSSFSGRNQCLQRTADVLQRWAATQDEPFEGPSDRRVQGFVYIARR